MRKRTIYVLVLAIALWAVQPAVLAAESGWLEWAGNKSYGVSSDTVPSDDSGQEKGDNWLTPGTVPEGSDQDEPKEDGEWLTPDTAPAKAPAKAPAIAPAAVEDGDAVINVTVPGRGEMVINPNRLTMELGGKKVQDQLISERFVLENNSGVPVTVGASLSVDTSKSGGVQLSSQPIGADEQEKLAYLYAEFHNLTDRSGEPQWDTGYSDAGYQLLASDSVSAKDVLRLDAAADGTPAYGAYRLYGALTENPSAGWHYGDQLTVTVSFTFRPLENTEDTEDIAEEVQALALAEDASEPVTAAEPAEDAAERAAEPEPLTVSEPDAAKIPESEPDPPAQTEDPEPIPEEKPLQQNFANAANPDWFTPPDAAQD